MEQTKGYWKVKGKIWSLNNKKPLENSATRFLSFGIQSSKDNSNFVQVGEWKNTTLKMKLKGNGMTETEEFNEQDAIDKIKEVFKDGDSVCLNIRTEVDTYRKSIKYIVNQMYLENEPIDFESPDFEEVNELNQSVIITEKPADKTVKVGVTTYKGEMIEQELKLNDSDINDYFMENAKVGDVMRLSLSVNRVPNYVDGGQETERKTLKGKTVKSGGRKIDGYTEFLEVTDVDLEKTEKQKYNREEIREALDLVNNKPEKSDKPSNNNDIKEDDLPY